MKRYISYAVCVLLLAAGVCFGGCDDSAPLGREPSLTAVHRKPVAVTGVTLDRTSLLLSKGDTVTLTATVLPENATDRSVRWSSSDTSVATVSSDGKVNAISAGTATITATSVSDTSVKATCTVTVMNVDGQENGHDFVDLGLTSGTLWATCNVGASSPFDYGNYYAWGETATKSSYEESNYSYSSNPTTLPVDRDAARANWGGSWLMPTKSDFQELKDECLWTWTTMDGKNGYKVSSRKNSSYIFLPAAGYFGSSLYSAGSGGNYWSSSLNTSSTSYAYELYFSSSDIFPTYDNRYCGLSVRPVLRKEVAVTGVTLDQTSLSLFKGEAAILTATVLPEDATDRSVTWTSSDTSVATVSSDGKVKAISAGTATITATSVSDTSVKATCTVTVTANSGGQENGHGYVDLGLTSGTLWATCNVGATSPEEYGNYYAWGETETKSSYTESNYSYSSYPTTLPVDRDAARANWGGSWLMPTKADFQELKDECLWTWTTMGGKNGYKVSSKKNSSYIFLPAADYFGSSLNFTGSSGFYWSSSLNASNTSNAYALYFLSSVINPTTSFYRYYGFSVRPVLRKEVAVTGVTLDQTSLSLFKGETATLTATVLPENATDRGVTWTSSDTSVATVSSDGKVKAISAGTATITATSVSDTSVKATCTVTVLEMNVDGQENGHGFVDLGLTSGTLWATCNVGASSPFDYGNYYAWGETATKSSYEESNYSYSSNPTTLPVDRDAARANWGGSWLMPTKADFQELKDECLWTWTTINGKNGHKVSSKKNSSYIFLPAAGYFGSSLFSAGSYGYYWSSSLYTSNTSVAFVLSFGSGYIDPTKIYSRYFGQSVRPVLRKEVAVTGVTLDQTSLSLVKGETATLIATVLPENATDKSVTWSSSNKSVATVSSDGKVTAVSAGTTTVTVTSVSDTSVKATCTVTVTANYGGQENGHGYVDLGLTSGTLWATCNVGASSPSDYGNYYAWGETTTKGSYTESTYRYSSNPTTLPLDRDAAHANWGGSWSMPTTADFKELYNECTWTWTTMNGKNGYKVSSRKNSSYIFLPAAGYFGYSLGSAGSYGRYWSSSLYTSYTSYAYVLYFNSSDVYPSDSGYDRYNGRSVRPVLRKEVAVTGVTLDRTSLSLNKGETATLIATVLPENATDKSVTWSSSNKSVATVSSDGKVTAVSAGTTTVTVTSVSDTSVKVTCTVTVTANSGGQENGHGYVDLGLTSGTLWATCNVGATSPEEYGNYYAWGETTTKSSYEESNYSYSSNPTTLPVDRDAARANWGGSWLMPTVADFKELYNECTWTWTTMNGKNGYKVSSKKNSSYIFLPAAGFFGSSLRDAGSYGSYWSSSLYTSHTSNAYELYIRSGYIFPTYSNFRYCGRSVRPVLRK